MRRATAALVVGALLAGCGTPTDPRKQAEELHSVAAEGALLAHEAAEGDTLGTFRRAHGRALVDRLDELRGVVRDARIARLVDGVGRDLETLIAGGDPASVERSLDRAADAAEQLAR